MLPHECACPTVYTAFESDQAEYVSPWQSCIHVTWPSDQRAEKVPSKLPPPKLYAVPSTFSPLVVSELTAARVPALRTEPFTRNGSDAPVTALTEPSPKPGFELPFSAVKVPPRTTLSPAGDTATAATEPPVTCGAQARSAPVVTSNAAIFPWATLPTDAKSPPT